MGRGNKLETDHGRKKCDKEWAEGRSATGAPTYPWRWWRRGALEPRSAGPQLRSAGGCRNIRETRPRYHESVNAHAENDEGARESRRKGRSGQGNSLHDRHRICQHALRIGINGTSASGAFLVARMGCGAASHGHSHHTTWEHNGRGLLKKTALV